ncbi:MAG: hypothetical protein MI922_01295, partial [Bacteroidales bacterium]|nr:hypothetical protein [Bacteroidales bacterium]
NNRFDSASTSYSFNGSSGMHIYNQTINNQSAAQSISLWFKTSDLNNVEYGGSMLNLSRLGVGTGSRFMLRLQDGYVDVVHGDEFSASNASWAEKIRSIKKYNNNQWHHIVAISEGDNKLASLYINNELIASKYWVKSNHLVTDDIQIKVGGDDIKNYFKGDIDDIRLYDRVLNSVEIDSLYHMGGWPILPDSLKIDYTEINESKPGASDGSIDITVSGGTKPYTFEWSNGEVTEDITNLSAGEYIIKITDALDSTLTDTIEIISEYDLNRGLVAYYPFNGNANDSSGNSNHGIEHSNEEYKTGVIGLAHDFNGTSDYIQLTNTLDNTNGLTFSFWINSKGLQTNENLGVIIGKYNMNTDIAGFNITSAGFGAYSNLNRIAGNYYKQFHPRLLDDIRSHWAKPEDIPAEYPSVNYEFFNPKEIELNSWMHCVVNLTPMYLEIHMNGELCLRKLREYTTYVNDANQPTYIGNLLEGGVGSNNHFHGLLDELRVYNRALTLNEIDSLYKQEYVEPLKVETIVINESKPGASDGSINITVSGGTKPYTFEWSNGEVTEDITNLSAGEYIIK